jgi:hypothetical protein
LEAVGVKKVSRLMPRSVLGRDGVLPSVRRLVSVISVVLVLITGTVVGTNLVTAGPAPEVSPVTVTFNYNGATGGTSVTSATVTPGDSADTVLPLPTKSGLEFSGWFNTQSLVNGQRITTIGEGDTGELLAGYVPSELAQNLNLVLPPPPPPPTCANGLATCVLGNIGPGGGVVFLISGGKTYEMAPKTWSGAGDPDAVQAWCDVTSLLAGTFGTAIGTGAQNTVLMDAACTTGAGQSAADYVGGGKSDWFLPSKDELNAMCTYSRTWTGTPSTAQCTGTQNVEFRDGPYGFTTINDFFWSSSQIASNGVWFQRFVNGARTTEKEPAKRVRPIRSF